MSTNRRTTHFGSGFGDHRFNQRYKIFYGEPSRIRSQPRSILSVEWFSRMTATTTVKVQPKMCFMRCGHAHCFQRYGLMITPGIIVPVCTFWVSENWLNTSWRHGRTYTSLLCWFGQSSIKENPLEQVRSPSQFSKFFWRHKMLELPLSEPLLHDHLINPARLHLVLSGNPHLGRNSR